MIVSPDYTIVQGNYSGFLFVVDPSIAHEKEDSGKYYLIPDFIYPGGRCLLYIKGDFEEGEGVDCEAYATFVY